MPKVLRYEMNNIVFVILFYVCRHEVFGQNVFDMLPIGRCREYYNEAGVPGTPNLLDLMNNNVMCKNNNRFMQRTTFVPDLPFIPGLSVIPRILDTEAENTPVQPRNLDAEPDNPIDPRAGFNTLRYLRKIKISRSIFHKLFNLLKSQISPRIFNTEEDDPSPRFDYMENDDNDIKPRIQDEKSKLKQSASNFFHKVVDMIKPKIEQETLDNDNPITDRFYNMENDENNEIAPRINFRVPIDLFRKFVRFIGSKMSAPYSNKQNYPKQRFDYKENEISNDDSIQSKLDKNIEQKLRPEMSVRYRPGNIDQEESKKDNAIVKPRFYDEGNPGNVGDTNFEFPFNF